IPAAKKLKYKDALKYLKENYPGLTPPAAGRPDRVFRVGADLEFLKSPLDDTADCVIFGHAGQVPDDRRYNRKFEIPWGVTLHFYTLHGQAIRTHPDVALNKKPDDDDFVFLRPPPEVQPQIELRNKKKGTLLRDRFGAIISNIDRIPKPKDF